MCVCVYFYECLFSVCEYVYVYVCVCVCVCACDSPPPLCPGRGPRGGVPAGRGRALAAVRAGGLGGLHEAGAADPALLPSVN